MNDFIKWCNDNQGFISAILALMSIILSVIAIFVSIKVAKLPFKKKIAVACYYNYGVGLSKGVEFLSVEATNIGNRILKIKYVGIGYKKHFKWKKAFNTINPNPSNIMLDINETIDAKYDMSQIDSMKPSKSLYGIAIDVDGKIYKRKIK